MGDRRQVHRREPIEVELDDGRIFVARPLPWLSRNELGSEILRQNTEAVNEAVKIYTDPVSNLVQLEMRLAEKISAPLTVLLMAYPDHKPADFEGLDYDEITQLMLIAVEVNHLDYIKHLVDPNFQPPTTNGGAPSSAEGDQMIGQKIESLLGSSSSASPETTSSSSPTEK